MFLFYSAARPSQDLLNLDFFSSSTSSTPIGGGYNLPSPLSPMADLQNSVSNSLSTTSNPSKSKI